MTEADWVRVIDQAVGVGVRTVQFIGGEPTVHPAFARLVHHALSRRLQVEVYTNLVHVDAALWELFERSGVTLATSYYSDRAGEHEAITNRRASHSRTLANITGAVGRGIPVRVAIIQVRAGQRTGSARAELRRLGVTEVQVGWVRKVGRAADDPHPRADELCGHCGHDRLAIGPGGEVWPCTLARSESLADIRRDSLESVLHDVATAVPGARDVVSRSRPCDPTGGADNADDR